MGEFMRKYAVGAWIFGKTGDRFVLEGYKDSVPVIQRIGLAATVPGVQGVELNYPADITDENLSSVSGALGDHGLKVAAVGLDVSCGRSWQAGAFAAKDAATRRRAVDLGKKAMDVAASLGCQAVNFWLGQDGYDYSFQADYLGSWNHLVKGVKECADHAPGIRLCLEYKPKEPRTHSFLGTACKALAVAQEAGKDNIGVTIDVGHALAAYENPAESAVLLSRQGRLFHMHFNDNYRLWDDDMIVGSVHFVEYLELIYWLDRVGYSGWYSLDVFPYREDPGAVCTESIAYLEALSLLIDRIGKATIGEFIERGDVPGVLRLLREHTLPRVPAGGAR